MKHKEPAFIRIGRTLKCVEPGEDYGKIDTYPSISAAKRRSRELQQDNGGRGQGYVRVQRKGSVKIGGLEFK